MKRLVIETKKTDNIYNINGDIRNVIKYFQDVQKELENYSDIDVEFFTDDADVYFYIKREETDYEYNARLRREEIENSRKLLYEKSVEERERLEYERLKKKYEK